MAFVKQAVPAAANTPAPVAAAHVPQPYELRDAPVSAEDGRRGPAQPLEPSTRRFMEECFGRGLGHVRVFQDEQAERAALSLGARAYAIDSDIVFARDRYAPGTSAGRELIAHELAHALQHERGRGPQLGPDQAEYAASLAARQVMLGRPVQLGGGFAPGIHRAGMTDDEKRPRLWALPWTALLRSPVTVRRSSSPSAPAGWPFRARV